MAKCICVLKDDDSILPIYGDEATDPKQWLFSLNKSLNQRQFIEVLVTLWVIWWARRKIIHEGEYQSPLSMHAFINRYMAEPEIYPF
jgi:hypothetical protein